MKKYLISGIPPSQNGVGYLMKGLETIANDYGYEVIYPIHIDKSVRKSLFNPFVVIPEILRRLKSKNNFISKLKVIKGAEVILIHPQTIGYKTFIELLKDNKLVKTYIMDNSFFCIKSYNLLNGSECLNCLNNLEAYDESCSPFPIKYKKDINIQYLNEYKNYAPNIVFYAQNKRQALLLKAHFGEKTKIILIGLKTGEIFEKDYVKGLSEQYDIVYHGANVEAKGFLYFIELAKKMHDKIFFMPYNKEEIPSMEIPKNLICKSMTWDTGLKDIVINAKLVLCPSLWSTPIEGALLKSIHYNGNVGIVKTTYGFGNDIPDTALLKLSADTTKAVGQINKFFIESDNISQQSKLWLSTYLSQDCKIDDLFKDVE